MRLRVLYHGNCFDGCSSAGLFARFYREKIARGEVDVAFAPLEHKGEAPAIPPALFDGDENVCVDFRYSQDSRLSWWFDHHVSAFQNPGDEAHFRADTSGQKFYDPAAKSCAKFLAGVLEKKFGFAVAPVQELVEWAEVIDGALFANPQMPVELKEPALRLMTWIENNRDPRAADRFILDLTSRPLSDIAKAAYVTGPLAPILEQHARNIDIVKTAARVDNGVVFVDLLDHAVATLNKFIVYYHFPEARYAVVLLATGKRLKISVGSNPWSGVPRAHNIAALCEKYGGGGHPVVGAISVAPGDIAGARKIAGEVLAALKG